MSAHACKLNLYTLLKKRPIKKSDKKTIEIY